MDHEQRRFFLTQLALAAAGTALIVAIIVVDARAHEATPTAAQPQGWVYPSGCCLSAAESPSGDCSPISPLAVIEGPDGYSVSLAPGQHPKLQTKGYSGVIPYSVARPSPDGEFHICLSTDGAHRYCFFAPPGAV